MIPHGVCDKFVKKNKINHIGTSEHIDLFLMCPMCLCVLYNYIFVADPSPCCHLVHLLTGVYPAFRGNL